MRVYRTICPLVSYFVLKRRLRLLVEAVLTCTHNLGFVAWIGVKTRKFPTSEQADQFSLGAHSIAKDRGASLCGQ